METHYSELLRAELRPPRTPRVLDTASSDRIGTELAMEHNSNIAINARRLVIHRSSKLRLRRNLKALTWLHIYYPEWLTGRPSHHLSMLLQHLRRCLAQTPLVSLGDLIRHQAVISAEQYVSDNKSTAIQHAH